MTNQYTTTGLKAILGFPFSDPRWKQKLLVGSLLATAGFVVPVLPWLFLSGYYALIIRHIIVDKGKPYIPDWNDLSEILEEGVRLASVGFIYFLPFILIMSIIFGVFFLPVIRLTFADSLGQIIPSDAFDLAFNSMFIGIAVSFPVMIVGIISRIIEQPAICHAVSQHQFEACFRLNEWEPVFRANWGRFILSLLPIAALNFVAAFFFQFIYKTLVLCVLLPFFWGVYYLYYGLISNVFFAMAYRDGLEKLAAKTAPVDQGQPTAA